jgi:hypothetical protein
VAQRRTKKIPCKLYFWFAPQGSTDLRPINAQKAASLLRKWGHSFDAFKRSACAGGGNEKLNPKDPAGKEAAIGAWRIK